MNWIPLAEGTLPPTTPHPKILVTNNLPARGAYGFMSHVWLVNMVHHDSRDGSWVAYEGDTKLWGLTHWRYALPEEMYATLVYTYDIETGLVHHREGPLVAKCLLWGLKGRPPGAYLHRCTDMAESIFTDATLVAKLEPATVQRIAGSPELLAQWINFALLKAENENT